MKRFIYFSIIVLWLFGVWEVGLQFSPDPMVVAQSGCPNLDVSCPSNCNYARDPYGGPVTRCTEVGTYPNITCCLYWCQMYRCCSKGMPPGQWCGLSQNCTLQSATFRERCVYLSGQGWDCK